LARTLESILQTFDNFCILLFHVFSYKYTGAAAIRMEDL